MDSFLFSLNATVPVFMVMIVGHLLKRRNIIDSHFASVADKLVFKVCLPCLVFLDLADVDIRSNFDISYVAFCFSTTLISILLTWFLARRFLPERESVGAFVQGAYRSSAAILGIAFIQNVYGTSGMAPLMIVGSVPLYNIFAVTILTLEAPGGAAADSRGQIRRACIGILQNPIIIGIAAGLLASLIRLPIPSMAYKTIHNLAVIASPLALLSIGVSFEGRSALSKLKATSVASFLKLIGWAALFLPLAVLLGFRDQKLIAILIMLASPCTPTAYIMAKNMGGDDVLTSSIVVATTFLSSLTLTFWIFLLRCLDLIR